MAQHRSMLKIIPNTCNRGQRRASFSLYVSWCCASIADTVINIPE